jgi:transcriptional regulator with XRE-family HTH domain
MNCTQPVDLQLNIAEQNAVVLPIHAERTLPLHRLSEARLLEGISRVGVARHLGITVREVTRQECRTTDLPLSVLHKWAKALGLPVSELVKETDGAMSTPLLNRARLVRVMKSAVAILKQTRNRQTKWLAQRMVDQLIEIMPELRGVTAWRVEGKLRRLDELGVAAERSVPDEIFTDVVD